jgi:hypothetical protein
VPAKRGAGAGAIVALAAVALLVAGGAAGFFLLSRKARSAAPVARAPAAQGIAVTGTVPAARALAPGAGASTETSWSGAEALACGAGEAIVLRGCRASLAGAAVRAKDDCKLTLIDCRIQGSPALEASDAADVTVQGGQLATDRGGPTPALRVSGHARVRLSGATLIGVGLGARVQNEAALVLDNVVVRRPENAVAPGTPWPSGLEIDGDAEVAMQGGSVRWVGHAVRMTEGAMLVARGAALAAERGGDMHREPSGLSAAKGSVALLVGGALQGPRRAASLDDSAWLTLEGARITGEVRRDDNSVVSTPKDSPDADKSMDELRSLVRARHAETKAEHDKLSRYARSACEGVFGCYADNFPGGPVSGTVTMRVDASGKVRSTDLRGAIPPQVGQCIRALGKDRQVPSFEGPPGELVCEYSGTITKGVQMLSIGSTYRKAR